MWTLQFTAALKHNPIEALNALIRTCLLEERSGDSAFTYAPKAGASQALKWTFHNVSAGHPGVIVRAACMGLEVKQVWLKSSRCGWQTVGRQPDCLFATKGSIKKIMEPALFKLRCRYVELVLQDAARPPSLCAASVGQHSS